MPNDKAAKPYARALFDLALDEKRLDEVWADVAALRRVLAGSDDLAAFLENYILPVPRRIQALGALFEGRVDPLTFRFMLFLEERKRLGLLVPVLERFEMLFDQRKGVLKVGITSAHPLDDQQVLAICERLRARLKKDIVPNVRVNSALLGGFRVQVDDTIYDYSINTQLNTLHRKLASA